VVRRVDHATTDGKTDDEAGDEENKYAFDLVINNGYKNDLYY